MRFFFSFAFFVLVLGMVSGTYLATKGGAPLPTKGGLAPPAKGQPTYPAKGQTQPPLKGLLRPKPVLPAKGRKPLPPTRVEQKIEQQVVQQEEELIQQQVEQRPLPAKRPLVVGITKWEQRIEPMPQQATRTQATYYKSKKGALKPQVEQVQQQLEQQTVQQEEELVQQQVEQKVEQRPLAQRPLYTPPKKPQRTEQRVIYENVRQIPTNYDASQGWD